MQIDPSRNERSSMINAIVIGASGYSGAELLRLLSLRDDVVLSGAVANTSAGKKVPELYPAFAGELVLEFTTLESARLEGCDVAFVALPQGEGMRVVPGLLGKVGRVIDLGGDFRLPDATLYQAFYGREHTASALLGKAVYGLPELNRDLIEGAGLVANPGCYATGAILPLLPLLKGGVITPRNIVINSLSGTSGAGRSSSADMSFSEVNENIRAYKVGRHQHIPEICSVLEQASGRSVSVSFVPHLVPLTRGIYTTIHAELACAVTEEELYELYGASYGAAPFVRVKREIPEIRDVLRTNYCDISFVIERRTNQIIILSVIDNLVKGAAGQALQNMNIMFGLPEETGLRPQSTTITRRELQ